MLVAYALTKYWVPSSNPVILLIKLPTPEPSAVCVPAIVGPLFIPKQTPLAVTGDFPSVVIFPPLVAVVNDMFVTDTEVSTGNVTGSLFLHP